MKGRKLPARDHSTWMKPGTRECTELVNWKRGWKITLFLGNWCCLQWRMINLHGKRVIGQGNGFKVEEGGLD